MENRFTFTLLLSDTLLSLLSLISFLTDVVLDLWTVACLYEEQRFISMGLLIVLLLSSSVLIQIFSWFWYSDFFRTFETNVEKFIARYGLLTLVHIFQLGVFLRFAAVIEISISKFKRRELFPRGMSMYMNHDLSMLRLFEAFTESAPQLILMMVLIMEMQEIHFFTVVKIIGSLSSLTMSSLSYHRNMRVLVREKFKMGWASSVVYFLWNLFLIGPRVMCVSLFASVLPCYVPAHFLSLWMLLVLWAWWQKTDFMDSKAGEWLYRATVALIWYFSWFSVTHGSTKHKGIIYHTVMGVDTMLLLGLWWWRRSVESAQLTPLPINPYLLILMLIAIYMVGVLLKLLYYWKFHPRNPDLVIDDKDEEPESDDLEMNKLQSLRVKCFSKASDLPETSLHKRVRNTALSFY